MTHRAPCGVRWFSSGWPSSGRNDWAGALFVRLPFSRPLQESLIHLPHPCPIPLGEGTTHFVLRHSLFGVRYWVFPALALFGLLHLEQVIPNEADIPMSRWPRENHRHVFFTFPCIGGNLQRAANTRARCAGQSCQANLPDAYSRGPDLQRRQRRLCIAV